MISEIKSSIPLVSVILPTFNRGWIVSEAIESVLLQTFEEAELIVVDDGSTDNTPEVLECFKDHIISIKQENSGVSAARNTGMAHARGRYFAFLDSDDLWLPEKLSEQISFFRSQPDALICQTEEIWIRNGLRVNPKERHKKLSGDIFIPSLALCLVSPSAVMIKRELIDEVGGFDEDLPACEDYDLWLRISRKYPVHLINKFLIVKRGGHEDQLSRASGLDRFRIASLKKMLDHTPLSPVQFEAAADMIREKCAVYAGGCKKRDRQEEAAYYIKLAREFA